MITPLVAGSPLVDYLVVTLLTVLLALGAVALWLAWRWLRGQELHGWAAVAVQAAEQIWNDAGTNEQKLQYALEVMRKVFPRLDEGLARALIETAVRDMPPTTRGWRIIGEPPAEQGGAVAPSHSHIQTED